MIVIVLCFIGNSTLLSAQTKHELVVCGDDKAFIFNEDKSDSTHLDVKWKWTVSEAKGQIPDVYQKWMIPLDECKPVDNGTKILLTSSGGGVLLLERANKRCLFYAHVPMAHSAELLPHGRVAVVLSTHKNGNSLELYNISAPEKCIYRDSLYSGHGVVWMPVMKRLFVLGYDELRAYSLKNWNTSKPLLKLEKAWKIPLIGGHDLATYSPHELLVTAHKGVVIFNADKETFVPFKPLETAHNIKSVNYDKETKHLVYTRAEIDWWTHHVYSHNPDKVFTINGINIYKVRTNFK